MENCIISTSYLTIYVDGQHCHQHYSSNDLGRWRTVSSVLPI